MPVRSRSTCPPWFCPDCAEPHPGTMRCPKALERRRAYDRDRGARLYGTRRWRDLRRAFLLSHCDCVMCGRPAQVVDHREPHRGDPALFWRLSNLQSLCKPCHDSTKRRAENRDSAQ